MWEPSDARFCDEIPEGCRIATCTRPEGGSCEQVLTVSLTDPRPIGSLQLSLTLPEPSSLFSGDDSILCEMNGGVGIPIVHVLDQQRVNYTFISVFGETGPVELFTCQIFLDRTQDIDDLQLEVIVATDVDIVDLDPLPELSVVPVPK